MYLGSVDETEIEDYFLEKDKFIQKKVSYVPGLIKIINEILDNSIDEAVRTNFEYANKIVIEMDGGHISISDNGRGIPVEIMKGTDEYIPVVLFTEAKAGSNFNDENRTTIGLNGIGSTITNVFSNKFDVTTCDGKKKLHLTCIDNNSKSSYKITQGTRTGTEVTFWPDLKRFGLKTIGRVYQDLIKQRLYFLSISFPQIKFTFNEEKIRVLNEATFISMFSDTYEYFKADNYFFAVTLSDTDDFRFFTYVNGLYIKDGGNHVNYLSSEIVNRIREKLEKKYKNIKPGDIKNKLRIIAFFKDFPNPKYNSQTKENLTNAVSEIKDFLGEIDFDKFARAVLRNEPILGAIEETYKIKEEFQKRKDLKEISKGTKKIHIDKYVPPIENNTYLCLSEGDSASSALLPILGRKNFGYFALRGKPLNVQDTNMAKIAGNEELKSIITILGADISKPVVEVNFENILMTTDQDLDGIHIRGLLLTFFHRFMPGLIKAGKIKYLKTPMICFFKKGVPTNWFFTFQEYNQWISKNDVRGLEFKYFKGLGSWKPESLKYILEHDKFDSFVETFEPDKSSEDYIKIWMSDNNEEKQNVLRNLSFDIERV